MYIDDFVEYLRNDRKMAANSLEAYRRDVAEFIAFQGANGVSDIQDTTGTDVVSFLHKLRLDGRTPSTVNRKLSSVKSFFNYLLKERLVSSNPVADIKSPKIDKKEIEYLSIDEIDRLLDSPGETPKGIRDRAILEMLYATGMRVSELIEVNLDDVNMKMGFVTVAPNSHRARIVPLGRPARNALSRYITEIRSKVEEKNTGEQPLFLNYNRGRISRQGLWKILKVYEKQAKIGHKLTPNSIRNSFAVHMLQNGADLKSLQELMGHEDITATQVYLSATKNRIKDVYDRTHPRA